MYIAVPIPSTVLNKKLNTMNNVGVGIMDRNLYCVCVYDSMHVYAYKKVCACLYV